MAGAGVAQPLRRDASFDDGGADEPGCLLRSAAQGRRDDLLAIARVHGRVLVAVEDDGRHGQRGCARGTGQRLRVGPQAGQRRPGIATAHRGHRFGQAAGRARRQPGVDADGGEDIGVGGGHRRGHRTARRQAGDIDTIGIGALCAHHRLRHGGDAGRLAAVAPLVVVLEPVPAARGVGVGGLRRIEHEAAMLVGQRIHAGPGGEIVGILRAAVQHHHQRP
jgi:hypothetical protein